MLCVVVWSVITILSVESLRTSRCITVIKGLAGTNPTGTVWFEQDEGAINVTVRAEINNLTPNQQYGWHIHEWGYAGSDGSKAGGHYNPLNKPPGIPPSANIEMGALGNLVADANGKASYNQGNPIILLTGANSVVGRSIVIHADPDPGTGKAGARIAFGVIGIASGYDSASGENTATASASSDGKAATCRWYGIRNNDLSGLVTLRPVGKRLRIAGTLCAGVSYGNPGWHAFHVHVYGEQVTVPPSTSGSELGAHWNPAPGTPDKEVGDLGNMYCDSEGVCQVETYVDGDGWLVLKDIIGRSLVIHQNPSGIDSFIGGSSGGAGPRVGSCVIGMADFLTVIPRHACALPPDSPCSRPSFVCTAAQMAAAGCTVM